MTNGTAGRGMAGIGVGGILVILGISLTGLVRIPFLERTWRPLDAGAAESLATATGSVGFANPNPAGETFSVVAA